MQFCGVTLKKEGDQRVAIFCIEIRHNEMKPISNQNVLKSVSKFLKNETDSIF